jgi:hypothetical protein
MPIVFVSVYLAFSSLSAFSTVCVDGALVPFNYKELVSCEEFSFSLIYIFLMVVFFIAGYMFSKAKHEVNISDRFVARHEALVGVSLARLDRISVYSFLFLILFFSFYQYVFMEANIVGIGRRTVLSDKFSDIGLILTGVAAAISRRNLLFSMISFVIMTYIAFVFAWVDGTRASMLPFVAYAIFMVAERKYIRFTALIALAIYTFSMSMNARYESDGTITGLLEYIFQLNFSVSNSTLGLGYILGFSPLHFTYVHTNNLGQFGFVDFFYSIVPLPSTFLGDGFRPSDWRVDSFRPMGAVAELLRVNLLAILSFAALLGYYGYIVDKFGNRFLRVVGSFLILYIVAISFQYNLRTVMWFVVLLVTIVLFERWKNSTWD